MPRIDVIATTISGSISDWSKMKHIVPLFQKYGLDNVNLFEVSSHEAARNTACSVLKDHGRLPISAGGSGTFRAVLEGCIESGVPLNDIRLGFLRKGSADLIGKTLGMPDEIESSISVLAKAIQNDHWVPSDILQARINSPVEHIHHFIGYGGVGIFGRIPFYTENRFMKYYKGILGQIFGDLGPFTIGMTLALVEKVIKSLYTKSQTVQLWVDGELVAQNRYQAVIVLNGYLGPDLPFTDKPLGSGEFYIFCIRDLGLIKLLNQAKLARSGTITKFKGKSGFESYVANNDMKIRYDDDTTFPVNIDGSLEMTKKDVIFNKYGTIPLLVNDHKDCRG
jgi:diacylglycerol kinase family enzyme